MHMLNVLRNNLVLLSKKNFHRFWLQRTLHVLYILSIKLLQSIANTLFDTIGETKGPLLYCLRFEMILNSWLLS